MIESEVMAKFLTALPFLPARRTLPSLARAATSCEGCDLFRRATQTVFGLGPASAELMLIGEMPGDHEDVEGAPFVGPAGRLLDRALESAGIDRKTVYVTNAVKHFRWEERGVRRLHKKPTSGQVEACRPWLIGEIDAILPRLIVCLGATASQSLLGSSFRITKARGKLVERDQRVTVLATYHPSAILRAPKSDDRLRMEEIFTNDLRTAARFLRTKRRGVKR
jgi:uracil-DNA glycosylase family protein